MLYHFYSAYQPKALDAVQRHAVARLSWREQLWTELPIRDESLPRLWEEEGKRIPYVRDVFDLACRQAKPEDVMVYTNADICVRSDCALQVATAMQQTEAFYSMRRDFNHDFDAPIPDAQIPKGDAYVGSDFYAFRCRWWQEHGKGFPDMLVGTELWDAVLRHLIESTNPGKLVSVPNLTAHRRHSSWWEDPKNRYRLKSQLHNLNLGAAWLRSHGIDPRIHGVNYGFRTPAPSQPNDGRRIAGPALASHRGPG